jgi:DNA-binding PucR family transcriptional regulator
LFELGNKTTDITDYLHPAVFCLVNYDNENHTEFLKTLYYYIINLKALLKTKDILHIHRNTLVYRINKIQEITNIDLDDGETFFQLYISFKGLEFIAHQTNSKISFC